jgi:16S rRNA (cytidine1402-2'-O)-methyltransferase
MCLTKAAAEATLGRSYPVRCTRRRVFPAPRGTGIVTGMNRRSEPRATTPPSSFTAFGIRAEAAGITPGLHVVATPIGNLGDVSFRALSTLAAAHAVLAEDTRVTKTLLAHYGITTPLLAYHEHNAAEMRPKVLARLAAGEALALVSDAGTPLVSDPGYKLVEAALEAGLPVTTVPGPSAVLAALVVAGLPTDRFFFEGFLPHKETARRERLGALAAIPGTLVFFESPRRLAEMLGDARDKLGDRPAAVARELTKLYETVRRGSLSELAAAYAGEGAPKGEIVVLIGPPGDAAPVVETRDLDAMLEGELEQLSVKDAVDVVAQTTGLPRKEVYARAVALVKAKRT